MTEVIVMKDLILVAYATKHGSTRDVADVVARTLSEEGLSVDIEPAASVHDLGGYQGVVLGSCLYTGRVHADARRFLKRHRAALSVLPVAVFAMGPLTMEAKDVDGSRAQLARTLESTPEVVPFSTTIFGGVVDPAVLRFPFSRMQPSDARDWDEIESWAREIASGFRVREPAGVAG
jgi:menaquinone-dependent protoporphyrinogen oxidase